MSLLDRYPSIEDLAQKAKRRIPAVAWSYLETGTGREELIARNREAFESIRLTPRFCKGELHPDLKTTLLGKSYAAPFGIAPIGLSGLMWPRSEAFLAASAARHNIPYTLSTVGTETPETIGQIAQENAWFQLYAPILPEVRADLLDRAWNSGFKTLVVTADVPVPSRRERTKRAGLKSPIKITPRLIWQGITCPAWSLATLRRGLPKLRTVEPYSTEQSLKGVEQYLGQKFRGALSWDYCKAVRDYWKGDLIIKGILHPEDAETAIQLGFDAIIVSNHGGRQFDAAPTSIEALSVIAPIVNGRLPLILDSGIRSGLDIIRALNLGADFVLLGRAFVYGIAALGKHGGDHVIKILTEDMKNNMIQLGVESTEDISAV